MSTPRVCLSLCGDTEQLCGWLRSQQDADLFEIRLDLSPPNIDGSKIRAATSKPLLFTAHGRPDLLEKYWPFADYVDVEQGEATGQNSIVSIHASNQDPDLLWKEYAGEHMTKIVLETENYDQIAQLIAMNREHSPLALCFASGEVGAFSRILSAMNGARWIYACVPDRATGSGQFTLQELLNVYQIRRFHGGAETKVFGIVGNPVSHSRSPQIHNQLFADASLPWIYLPFRCKNLRGLFESAPKWNTKGFSITHPYKEQVLSFLDAASPEVTALQACNTVGYFDQKWQGINTDIEGIRTLLKDVPVQNSKIVLIGAGSSARAIGSVVFKKASELTILNRTQERAKNIAQALNAKSGSLEDLRKIDYDILIQATSVGWLAEESPVNTEYLRPGKIVIDSVYQDTELLRKARDLGCKTINGEVWFRTQAQAQFEWWKKMLKVKG
jgi:3-dehydroquinate dehydratase / shikimate dehydrogenase